MRTICLTLVLASAAACQVPGLAAVDAGGCEEGNPDEERRGTDCLCCHEEFGIAGTFSRESVPPRWVKVRDATGAVFTMGLNTHGNFFHFTKVTPPIEAWTEDADGGVLNRMQARVAESSCNRCHREGGEAGGLVY
ncbi:MAG: hypothetical protein AB2A00_18425 [Myxococcota bacterium]